MIHELFPSFFRPVASIAGAGACWAGQIIADAVPTNEMSWISALVKEVGLPVTFLILVIYAVVAIYKELKATQAGRLADRDAFQTLLLNITEQTRDRQERQIIATDNLAGEFAHLSDKIQNCQNKRPS